VIYYVANHKIILFVIVVIKRITGGIFSRNSTTSYERCESMQRILKFITVCLLVSTSGVFAQTHFTYTKTSSSTAMTILIQQSINPTVNGVVLSSGDEIGVFTSAGLCVGAGVWTGTGNISIAVWPDDANTTAIDGAVTGDSLFFRAWDTSVALEGKAIVTWLPVGSGGMTEAYTFSQSTYGGLASFAAIVAPNAPTLTSPASGATSVSTTPALTWNTVAAATTYRVEVSTTSTFAKLAVDDSTLTAATKTVTTALNSTTTYYWRVNAKNASGTSSWSSIWSFTTAAAPPSAPASGPKAIPARWTTASGGPFAEIA